ncbi:hypothetical protein DFR24_3267 [Panacagrimonas perspica]|uniref:HNH endonuclease n=1 Tax=Panacagrimonas perspica TaxID=381431 RepID=A0A4R7P580_9GAMM|nr:hypothetical protein [Panacagrimonas perspica]TDU28887.1 hypothetical protein DFR24_3267 [Panacagrimonas perspica]THD02286.1 hypothetical protein B1810_15270 [Panacagrimonas perspica]
MDPQKLFSDSRFDDRCAHCNGQADTRDHVPSKVLLDKPYPGSLPVVGCCAVCNAGFSDDEAYVAAFLECVIRGTTVPDDRFRPKIAALLKRRPNLAERIESSKSIASSGIPEWSPDGESLRKVVLKLARGHIAYELGQQRPEEPLRVDIAPFNLMTPERRREFEEIPPQYLYPELGSRSFITLMEGKPCAYGVWLVVQSGRYRYAVGQGEGDWVRFMIGEYLACRVEWD